MLKTEHPVGSFVYSHVQTAIKHNIVIGINNIRFVVFKKLGENQLKFMPLPSQVLKIKDSKIKDRYPTRKGKTIKRIKRIKRREIIGIWCGKVGRTNWLGTIYKKCTTHHHQRRRRRKN